MKKKTKKSKEKPAKKVVIEKNIEEEQYTDLHTVPIDSTGPDYPFEDNRNGSTLDDETANKTK